MLLAGPLLLWWVSDAEHLGPIAMGPFLLMHTAIETVTVVVALLVFVTGHRALLGAGNGPLVLLGQAFLGVALLDYLHLMSYVGMPDAVTINTQHKSIFFWLCARLLAALALLLYAAMAVRSAPPRQMTRPLLPLALTLAWVGICAWVWLAAPERIPALFVAGQGLTPLKIGMEYLVVGVNATTLAVLCFHRTRMQHEQFFALGTAVALSIFSELFFTLLSVKDKDSANALGHLYKLAAYVFLYRATFHEALRRPLQEMQVQHLREKLILSTAPDGVLWVDQGGTILMANRAMETMSGYSMQELVGQQVNILLPAHMHTRHTHSMQTYFSKPQSLAMAASDLQLQRRNGDLMPVDIALGHWEGRGQRHAIAYIRDLTDRKKLEATLRRQATHDELTGLPNRWFFNVQLEQALRRSQRSGLRMAVLLLDLDYFKTINDSFGHAMGDALLVQVATRIRASLRDNDVLARLGGDEFVVLLTDLASVDEAVNVAAKLLNTLQAAYSLDNKEVYSGASLGMAFFPSDAQDGVTLLRYADMAMYQAKNAGRGTYACYSQEMDRRVHEDMQMHTKLKEAIARELLTLHYQPQVEVASNAIVGAEALLRWHDTELGDVAPLRCIGVAEATGLILPLSDWVLLTACRQIAAWQRAGTPIRVSVNVSAQLFRQRNLVEKVSHALEQTGALAHWLDIEITESVAMDQTDLARQQIEALVALGCTVVLDDFGTGYSSLAYLKTLPVSKLKIDKTFMDGVPHDANDVTLARTIIAMAHNLGLGLVAEGVETQAQLDFLRQHGCQTYQGWLFAKAMDAGALGLRLKQPLPAPATL